MGSQVLDFTTLFSNTWEKYKVRALPILAVMLLTFAGILVVAFLFILFASLFAPFSLDNIQNLQPGQFIWFFIICFFIFIPIALAGLWSQAATMAIVVDDKLEILESLSVGWHKMWSFAWVSILFGGIALVGFAFFLVPGIIFSTWFCFSMYILFEEKKGGMDAILASRNYVKGYTWNTFLKFFVLWLLYLVLAVIPFIGQLLGFLFTPFMMLYLVAIYRNLKEVKGEEGQLVQPSERKIWFGVAICGMVLPLIGLIVSLTVIGPRIMDTMGPFPGSFEQTSKQDSTGTSSMESPEKVLEDAVQKADTPIVSGDNVWHDPIGDVMKYGVGRWLDISEVTATGKDDNLILEIKIKHPFAAFYNAGRQDQPIGKLVSFYLDADLDRATGGEIIPGSGRGGYETGLDVILEALPEDKDAQVVHVSIVGLGGNRVYSRGRLTADQVTLSKNTLQVSIPYTLAGVKSGDLLRLCYRELAQEFGEGIAKDKIIQLQ